MLYWAVVFLLISLVSALFGFGGISSAAAGMSQMLFYVFIILFVISLVFGLSGRGRAKLP